MVLQTAPHTIARFKCQATMLGNVIHVDSQEQALRDPALAAVYTIAQDVGNYFSLI